MKRLIISSVLCLVFGFHNSSADVIHVPGDYPTIQEGIDAAYQHDTVLVKPGEYVENIDFIGKNIVVASLFLTSGDPEFIESTIIDGDSAGSVVTFQNGEDSTAIIVGFALQHGYSENGGGIYCLNSGPSIISNIIRENSSYYTLPYTDNGGGIYCDSSNAIITYNTIYENRACYGGGIYCDYSGPVISNNIVIENIADP